MCFSSPSVHRLFDVVDISLLSDILASPSFRVCNNCCYSDNQLVIYFIVYLPFYLWILYCCLDILASPSFRMCNNCCYSDNQLVIHFIVYLPFCLRILYCCLISWLLPCLGCVTTVATLTPN
jgi:hypothetical protein